MKLGVRDHEARRFMWPFLPGLGRISSCLRAVLCAAHIRSLQPCTIRRPTLDEVLERYIQHRPLCLYGRRLSSFWPGHSYPSDHRRAHLSELGLVGTLLFFTFMYAGGSMAWEFRGVFFSSMKGSLHMTLRLNDTALQEALMRRKTQAT